MVDVEVNRGGATVEGLYSFLLTDSDLRFVRDDVFEGQHCAVIESSAEVLTAFLYVPGKATLLINKATGFPVRISVRNGGSSAVITYDRVDLSPPARHVVLSPPAKVTFDVITGQEQLTNGTEHAILSKP